MDGRTHGRTTKLWIRSTKEQVMDNVIDDIAVAERRCDLASKRFDDERIKDMISRLIKATQSVGDSWSKSYWGYQAHVYYAGLRRPPSGAAFSREFGLMDGLMMSGSVGEWAEYDPQQIHAEVLRRAGNPDMTHLSEIAREVEEVFERSQEEILAVLDASLASKEDTRLREIREEIKKLNSHVSQNALFGGMVPGGQHISRDMRALEGGIQCPMHLAVQTKVMESLSYGTKAAELGKAARAARLYLEKRFKLRGASVARTDGNIFIGHGRAPAWLILNNFLRDTLQLPTDEFEMHSPAGMAHSERLQQMLDGARFAFLVMTAEDEHADKTKHARESVIHEVGLFQGRLGFRRAIVVLEEGCEEFTNIVGHGQIRFPPGRIKASFEDVRKVLAREGIK
jgi:predicted nucleotide-binding protein